MMRTDIKQKSLWIISAISALLIIGQGIYNWKLTEEITQLKQDRVDSTAMAYSFAAPWMDPWQKQWDPMGSMTSIQKQMDQMMNSFSPARPFWGQSLFKSAFPQPDIQLDENDHEYTVTLEVPKGQHVELNTELSGNRLSISGQVKNTQEDTLDNSFSTASTVSQFSQSLYLSAPVNELGMKTEHEGNKVLIIIPKT